MFVDQLASLRVHHWSQLSPLRVNPISLVRYNPPDKRPARNILVGPARLNEAICRRSYAPTRYHADSWIKQRGVVFAACVRENMQGVDRGAYMYTRIVRACALPSVSNAFPRRTRGVEKMVRGWKITGRKMESGQLPTTCRHYQHCTLLRGWTLSRGRERSWETRGRERRYGYGAVAKFYRK